MTRLEPRRLLSAAPIADAGGPYSVDEGGSVVLDASGTTDDVDSTSNLFFEWDLDGDGFFGETGFEAERGDELGINPVYSAAVEDGNGQSVAVSLRVLDSEENVGTAEANITIENVAPTVEVDVTPGTVQENSFSEVTVSGTVTDPLDSVSSVVVTWGDGTTSSSADGSVALSLIEGGVSYTASHRYVDDPAGTGTGESFAIIVTATDDDGGIGTGSSSVIVENVDPQLSQVTLSSSVNEGGTATLDFSVYDQGENDVLSLTVDWGDGVTETYTNVEQGYGQIEHVYRDDGLSGPSSELYTVIVTLTDDDGGLFAVSTSTTVNNVDPEFTEVSVSPTSTAEGQPVTISGGFADAGLDDTHSLTVDWGDGTTSVLGDGSVTIDPSTRTFSATHIYRYDATFFPLLTLTDDDGGGAVFGDFSIDVSNVPPTVSELSTGDSNIVEGQYFTLTGLVVDPGYEWFTIVIDWGDGTNTVLYDQTSAISASTAENAPPPDSFDPESRRFTASHMYLDDDPTGTSSDLYSITITVYDSEETPGEVVLPVTVFNAAPVVTLEASPGVVDENSEVVTVTGQFTDAGVLDEHVVVIDWRDGTVSRSDDQFSNIVFNEDGSFTAYHYYVDDNPSGTPQDTYAILVSVVDDDGGVGTATADVIVRNVAPELYDVTVDRTVVDENSQPVTVSGFVYDYGYQDELTVVIAWGDGTFSSSADGSVVIDVEGYFTASHVYLDDTPTGTASDSLTIVVTATDDDGGETIDNSQVVTVRNISPTLSGLVLDREIDENRTATLSGRISDASPHDSFQVLVDWGDGTRELFTYAAGTTAFSEQHVYRDDDPSTTSSDQYLVTVTLVDDDTGQDSDQATITVHNVVPMIEQLQIDQASVQVGQPFTLIGRLTDQGPDDSHQVVIFWGDGSSSSTASGAVEFDAATGMFRAVHIYETPGTAVSQIDVTVYDDDGGEASRGLAVEVRDKPPNDLGNDPRLAIPNLTPPMGHPLLSHFAPTPESFLPFMGRDDAIQPRRLEPPAMPEVVSVDVDDLSEFALEEVTADSSSLGMRVVLRVIDPSGSVKDEIDLDEDVLTQLPGWYSRLLDDRYRIYLIREDGTELMHSDVVVRQGRPIDPNDAVESDELSNDRFDSRDSAPESRDDTSSSLQFNQDETPEHRSSIGPEIFGTSFGTTIPVDDVTLLDEAIRTWQSRPLMAVRTTAR